MARYTRAVKIDIAAAPGWIKMLEGKRRQAARRGLISAGHQMVSVIQNEIIPSEPRVPVDRGIYRGAWKVKPEEWGALVWNSAPHAPIVEDGARAENVKVGRAMIDALTEWVLRKKLATDQTEARHVAWAVAQSMKRNGIFDMGKGLKIMAKAARRLPEMIVKEVTAELKRVT